MSFQQLVSIIPLFEQVESSHIDQTLVIPPDRHTMIVVTQGHLSITGHNQKPVMVSQGFACHPKHSPYIIQVPKTKEAEYVVISYCIFPEHSTWTLNGTLNTFSEVKIKYMLDELLRSNQDDETSSEEEIFAQQVRTRLILERILFIYMYDQWLIPLAAVIGADLMLLADCIGRIIIIPREVPVGVMTAVIGAPYFIYLLQKDRKRRLS